jgi:hypothetical protein
MRSVSRDVTVGTACRRKERNLPESTTQPLGFRSDICGARGLRCVQAGEGAETRTGAGVRCARGDDGWRANGVSQEARLPSRRGMLIELLPSSQR